MLTDKRAARAAMVRDRINADIQPESLKKVVYQTRLGWSGGKLIRAVWLKLTPATTISGAARNSTNSARNKIRAVLAIIALRSGASRGQRRTRQEPSPREGRSTSRRRA